MDWRTCHPTFNKNDSIVYIWCTLMARQQTRLVVPRCSASNLEKEVEWTLKKQEIDYRNGMDAPNNECNIKPTGKVWRSGTNQITECLPSGNQNQKVLQKLTRSNASPSRMLVNNLSSKINNHTKQTRRELDLKTDKRSLPTESRNSWNILKLGRLPSLVGKIPNKDARTGAYR